VVRDHEAAGSNPAGETNDSPVAQRNRERAATTREDEGLNPSRGASLSRHSSEPEHDSANVGARVGISLPAPFSCSSVDGAVALQANDAGLNPAVSTISYLRHRNSARQSARLSSGRSRVEVPPVPPFSMHGA
jgi:hypothetical protein